MTMLTNDKIETATGTNGHSKPGTLNGSHLTPALSRSGLHRKSTPQTMTRRGWRSYAGYAAATGIAAVALGAGVRPWLTHRTSNGGSVKITDARRSVTVTHPEQQRAGSVRLPATVEAFQSARLFARVPGYVKAWHAEIGQEVTRGQLLVEIDTPELDQELLQARADLSVAKTAVSQAEAELRESEAALDLARADRARSRADVALAQSRLRRREALLAKNAATADDLDTATRDYDARQADLAATEAGITRQLANLETRKAVIEARKSSVESQLANVRRLEQLQSFRRIEAPYDGVVTNRQVEIGNLVSATAAGEPLYEVAQVNRVRVQVAVPQSEAAAVHVGSAVTVRIPERPGQEVVAKVTRTSQSVNPTTRTLLAEIEIPNPQNALSPGLYADVQFETQAPDATWLVPSNTVRMQVDGPHVVVATDEGRLSVQSIRLGRDYGRHVAVLEGVNGGEQLVVNPTDDLQTGMSVEVIRPVAPTHVAAR
jgi:RND family efflux transporter MFP subunit